MIAGFVVVLIGAAFAFKRFVSRTGYRCKLCGDSKLTPFGELSSNDRQQILGYFRNYERRTPEEREIWVCKQCNTVLEDSSGQDKSVDANSIRCKVCSELMPAHDPGEESIVCQECGKRYLWEIYEGSRFRFLMLQ